MDALGRMSCWRGDVVGCFEVGIDLLRSGAVWGDGPAPEGVWGEVGEGGLADGEVGAFCITPRKGAFHIKTFETQYKIP